MEDARPLFIQIAESIEDQIVSGVLPEGAMVPSTNSLAAFYRINPATAAKGMHLLQDEGVIEKRRGLGMFVTAGARKKLLAKRHSGFEKSYVQPLVSEAAALGMTRSEVVELVEAAAEALDEDDAHDRALRVEVNKR